MSLPIFYHLWRENLYKSINKTQQKQWVPAFIKRLNMDISKEKILHKFCPDQLYFMVAQKNEYIMNELDDALASLTVDEPTYLYQLQKTYFPMYEINELDKEEENYLKAFGTIRVGVPADRYPISKYDSRSGTCKGMIEDYLEVLAEKINVTFETVPITEWGDEKVDLYLPVTKEEINYHEEIKEVSESFMESALYAFVREGEELQASKQWDIGIPKGILDKKGLIVKRYPNANLITYEDVKSCLKDVKSGKLDGMVHNVYVLNYQQRNSGHHRLQVSSMIHIPVDYSFGGTKEKSKLIRILNKGIRQIDSGDVDQILATYVGDPEERTFWDVIYINKHIVLSVIGVAFIFILFVILFVRQKEGYFGKIKEANEELLKANSAKTDFLSKMSHEIRTPMNAIIGMARLAQNEMDVPSGVDDYLKKIGISSEYLLSILNDILDMSVIESGKFMLHPTWESPECILEPCIEMLEPLMLDKKIQFIYPDWKNRNFKYEYYIDSMRTRQVLMNLLNNALKFTPEGGTIEFNITNVSLEQDFGVDLITVRDSGCGIPKDNLKKVFEPFEQGDNAYKSTISGTGLGLTIVSQIVQAMGGKIKVESKLKEGTTFQVEFPYRFRVKEQEDIFIEQAHGLELCGKRVLLVEDNIINTEVAQKLLENKGMIVYNASDGKVALEEFINSPKEFFDVILMDVRMPVMDGIEATKAIRESSGKDALEIPIIAMTADAFYEDIQKTKEAGMDEHLSKPIQPEQLYETIQKAIFQRKKQK